MLRPAVYKLPPNDTSRATNNRLFIETSPTITLCPAVYILPLNDASPAINKR